MGVMRTLLKNRVSVGGGKWFRKKFSFVVIVLLLIGVACEPVSLKGQEQMLNAKIVVTSDRIGEVDPKVYGHFIAHNGRCIYGGVWVGENSRIPNLRGLRLDVLKATEAISPSVIRWAGPNFVAMYHWKDGVGPRNRRRPRAGESNAFGTDEFIDFCREVGAEPFMIVMVSSNFEVTPQEAAEWVEYCNGGINTTYGKLRAEYGHPEPYNVKYWGLGNEVFGSWHSGQMDATQYAQAVIEFTKVMKSVDPSIKIVAVGWFGTYGDSAAWNKKVLEIAGDYIDYLSLHAYCWKPKPDAYSNIMNWPLDIERDMKTIARMIRTVKPDKDIKIALDEWNVWYEEATYGSGLMQSVRLCDGLMAAGMFHVFHRLCNNVTMANFAQLVNALPAIVTNDKGEMYLTPVYLVFKLYRDNTGKISLKTSTTGVSNRVLDVSATMDEEGNFLYLAVINKDLTKMVNATVLLSDFKPKQICRVSQLNGPYIYSKNDFDSPDNVKITSKYVNLSINDNGSFTYVFEPHSVTILALESVTSTATPPPEEAPDTETLASESGILIFQQVLGIVGVVVILTILILKSRVRKT